MGDEISIFNTEGDYKVKPAYRIKDGRGEKVKIRNPVFKMEWGSIKFVVNYISIFNIGDI